MGAIPFAFIIVLHKKIISTLVAKYLQKFILNILQQKTDHKGRFKWRRIWDSNPGDTRMPDGFQDRSDQPLRQSSEKLLYYNTLKNYYVKHFF